MSCSSPEPRTLSLRDQKVLPGREEGDSEATGDCNTQACESLGAVTECLSGLPYAPNTACLAPASSKPFTKLVKSSKLGDIYGVRLVAGPEGSVAALYVEQEWFERLPPDGTVLQAPFSLPQKNPDLFPASLCVQGFPAFYGPALGYNGTDFVVARPANEAPDLC